MQHKFWTLIAILFAAVYSFLGFDWGIVNAPRLNALGLQETPHLLEDIVQLTREQGYRVNLHVTTNEDGLDLPYMKSVRDHTWEKDRVAYLRIYRHFLSWSYSGDVATAFGPISTMNPRRLDFNPHSFQYGGAFLYPLAVALQISAWMGYSHVVAGADYYIRQPLELRKLILAGRTLVVLMHLMTLLLIYKAATLWEGKEVGILAVLLYLFLPGPLCLAREMKPHAYAMVWVMGSFYFGLRYFREGRDWDWILSSIGAGLAAGSVPNYGIAILYPLLAIGSQSERKIRDMVLSMLLFGFTLLITNPYALLSYPLFLQEMTVLKRVFIPNAEETKTPWMNIFARGMPWWLSLTSGASLLYYLFGTAKRSEKFFMAALPIVYVISFYMVSRGVCPTRFALIIYPSMILWTAGALQGLIQRTRGLGLALAAILIGLMGLNGTAYVVNFSMDARGQSPVFHAGRFLNALPAKTQIGSFGTPGPGTLPAVPFHRYNLVTFPTLQRLEQAPAKDLPTYLVVADDSISQVSGYTQEKIFLPFSFGTRTFFRPDAAISVGSPAQEIKIYRKMPSAHPSALRSL